MLKVIRSRKNTEYSRYLVKKKLKDSKTVVERTKHPS